MSDLQLHERLTDLVDDQPPMTGGPADDLRRGRRSLAVRRGAGVVATAAVVTAGTALAWPGPSSPDTARPAGLSADTILERCSRLGRPALDAHWDAGARILTSASSAGNARAVLVSADGERWADCWLRDDETGPGSFATYPMTGQRPGAMMEFRTGETGPRAGVYSLLERFPSDVARVELRFDDGREYDARAVDGFVVFQLDDITPAANLDELRMYDAEGDLVAGPDMGPGDADVPPEYRTRVPMTPIDEVGTTDGW